MSFTVLASTNLALPNTPGQTSAPPWNRPSAPANIQFTDPQATNNARRFYRVHSP